MSKDALEDMILACGYLVDTLIKHDTLSSDPNIRVVLNKESYNRLRTAIIRSPSYLAETTIDCYNPLEEIKIYGITFVHDRHPSLWRKP